MFSAVGLQDYSFHMKIQPDTKPLCIKQDLSEPGIVENKNDIGKKNSMDDMVIKEEPIKEEIVSKHST